MKIAQNARLVHLKALDILANLRYAAYAQLAFMQRRDPLCAKLVDKTLMHRRGEWSLALIVRTERGVPRRPLYATKTVQLVPLNLDYRIVFAVNPVNMWSYRFRTKGLAFAMVR